MLDVDRARCPGVGDEAERADVVAGAYVIGERQQADEVGRHHDRRLDPMGLDRAQHVLGIEAAEHDDRYAGRQQADARQGAGVVHRTDDEVCAEGSERAPAEGGHMLGHRAAAGEHRRWELDALRPTGGAGGVHEVGQRLDVGTRLGRRRRRQPVRPRLHAVGLAQAPADDDRHADPAGGFDPGHRRPRADEEHGGAGVPEDVRHLVGIEVEVDRHRRRPGQEAAEVREHGLHAVLGEHCDAAVGAEIELGEPVHDAVQDVVHCGPAERDVVVAQRHLVRAFGGEPAGDKDHQS